MKKLVRGRERKLSLQVDGWLAGLQSPQPELAWYWRWPGQLTWDWLPLSKYRRRGKHSSPVTFSWVGGSPRAGRTLRMSVAGRHQHWVSHGARPGPWSESCQVTPRREEGGEEEREHHSEVLPRRSKTSVVIVTLPRPPVSRCAVQLSTNFSTTKCWLNGSPSSPCFIKIKCF